MKKFDVTLHLVTMTKENVVLNRNHLTVTVLANDRGGAILAGLDVGQAIARSGNSTHGEVGIFFQAGAVTEHELF